MRSRGGAQPVPAGPAVRREHASSTRRSPSCAPPGSRCCRSCAAPTRSRRCRRRRRRCCRSRRSTRRAAQQRPEPAAHRAPAGRAAPAQPVPAALALGGADRAPARRAGGADGAQLPAGLLLRALLPRRRASARTAGAGRSGVPAIVHALLPRLAGAERADGDHPRRAPGHLALGGPVHRAHLGDRRPPARLRHPGRPDRGQAERGARPGPARRRSATGSSSSAGSPRRRGSTCCWTPGGGTRRARSARCASPATASCARWSRRPPRERADVSLPRPARPGRGARRAATPARWCIAASTWHDVLPTVIIEALAAGRPVLGTALGGIPYLVGADDPAGAAGWVVAAGPGGAGRRAARSPGPAPPAWPRPPAPATSASSTPTWSPSQLLDIYTSLTPSADRSRPPAPSARDQAFDAARRCHNAMISGGAGAAVRGGGQRREARAEKAMLASRKPPLTTVKATISPDRPGRGRGEHQRRPAKITAP